jgi:steroid 5-alpha reductase family enzyme
MSDFSDWLFDPQNQFLGNVPSAAVLLFFVALLLSSLGFARTVYFIGVGYGLSVAGVAFFSFAYYRSSGNLAALIHMLLVVVHGFRLAAYLTMRDRRSEYQNARIEVEDQYGNVAVPLRFAIWIGVGLLYVAMASPVLFHFSTLYAISHRLIAPGSFPAAAPVTVAGLVLGFLGFMIEWRADVQKTRAKRRAPGAFCSSGLYRIVRYPNYFGEILLWLGVWIAGAPFYLGAAQWALSLIGLAAIVLIMLGSARRLEGRQETRYGTDPEFRQYVKSVPILFPFVPLYSLKRLKVYLG